MTTEHAPSTRPTRTLTRRRTGRRSVRPRVSGKPRWRWTKDELAKLMSSVGTELAKESQEIKRNWVPRSDNKNKENDQNKDKDKNRGKKGGRKKGINDVEAEENTPLPQPTPPGGAPAAKGPS